MANYVRYRPDYPPAVVALLAADCGLTPASLVADIGCGTGLLAERFLQNGNRVLGVEPNRAMREAGHRPAGGLPSASPRLPFLMARPEATTPPSGSVEFLVAGQAFHWFEPAATRREFARVLKPDGWVALVWNERRTAGSDFLTGYEALIRRFAPDYAANNHRNVDRDRLAAFFAPGQVRLAQFAHAQRVDLDGIRGRLLSSSYTPEEGHPNHRPMLAALEALVAAQGSDGWVSLDYDTKVWFGRLA